MAPLVVAAMKGHKPADLIDKWNNDARDLERDAGRATTTPDQKRLLNMHARVKRACAIELRALLERGKDGRS